MTTTADKEIEETKVQVQLAIQHLSRVVIEKCSGADDYGPKARARFAETLHELVKLRNNGFYKYE